KGSDLLICFNFYLVGNKYYSNFLHIQKIRKNKWRNYGRITFYDEFWGVNIKFSPGNLFIGHCARVTSVAGCGITYLAEIAPKWSFRPFHILIEHWHHTDWEISSNSPTYLKETDSIFGIFGVPFSKKSHILNPTFHCGSFQFTLQNIACEDVAHGAIFPTWADYGQVFFGGCIHPRIF